MDIIAEPPWMASWRVTEAIEFGVSTTEHKPLIFVISSSFPAIQLCKQKQPHKFAAVFD
ncbi:hypothetical protein [Shewanella sp. GD03713]|uniref:hypothetical protein n=1 Tax=Shewanella sp. GD03713 TaxID=2975372 RepID=UPI001593DE65|nr:hypothetical protein [Shewanella sp. GD03713]MDH1470976.1 hypothetical protein [Shewanella sp. GD03713]QXN26378.1 hypothetical protein KVP08_007325 [Shewanella putrefaciens]